jgi:hypothetical protein
VNPGNAIEDLAPLLPQGADDAAPGFRGQEPWPPQDELASGVAEGEAVSAADALKSAVGYYLRTIPALLFNPGGTIRTSTDEQPLPGITKLSLGMFLMPALVIASVLMMLGGILGAVIAGGDIPIAGGAIGVAVAVVAAIISGFLTHPIVGFVVDKLGGQSDERSRTNYAAISMAAAALMVVPAALSALLGGVVAKFASSPSIVFVMVIPALIAVLAYAWIGFVGYRWTAAFQLPKWVGVVALVMTVAGAAFGLYGVVNAIRAGLAAKDVPTLPTIPTVPPGGAGPTPAGEGKPLAVGDVGAGSTKPVEAVGNPGTDVKTIAVEPAQPEVKPQVKTPDAKLTEGARWARKRAEVETALADDPLLINDPEIRRLYVQYSAAAAKARSTAENTVLDRKKTNRAAMRLVLEKVTLAEEFTETSRIIDSLHTQIEKKKKK